MAAQPTETSDDRCSARAPPLGTTARDTHHACLRDAGNRHSEGESFTIAARRRGGRAVECTGLENRQGGDTFEGSNPSLSARSASAATSALVTDSPRGIRTLETTNFGFDKPTPRVGAGRRNTVAAPQWGETAKRVDQSLPLRHIQPRYHLRAIDTSRAHR
jgi:hypothetical protein